jgi:hypothetical protein
VDYQTLFNIAIMLAAFFGGWVLRSIYQSVERLDKDVRTMPERYLAKDDYRQDLQRVEAMLTRILDKLDGKADK